jgi:hypothetical protein
VIAEKHERILGIFPDMVQVDHLVPVKGTKDTHRYFGNDVLLQADSAFPEGISS